jgi:hypothetical protein
MSGVTKEWLAILLCLLLALAQTLGEAWWLRARGWAGWTKALLFVCATNFIGCAVGFSVLFVVVGTILALAFSGDLMRLHLDDAKLYPILAVALLFTPVLLILLKRLGLRLLDMQRGAAAWLFAVASSLLLLALPLGATILLTKIFWRFL